MKNRTFLKLIVVIIFMIIAYGVCGLTPYYIETTHYEDDEIRVVIDDNEYTKSLPNVATFIDGKVMLSIDTITKYFDKYIFMDEKYNTIIVASGDNVVKMPVNSNEIEVNGAKQNIDIPVQYINDEIYVPIEELADIYNLKIVVNEKIIITTNNMTYYEITVDNKIHTKKYKKSLCMTTDIVKNGEILQVFDEYEDKKPDDYLWVRTSNGSFGYVKKKNIVAKAISTIKKKEEQTPEKISLIWEYATNYSPDRSGQNKKAGMDIVSPTWIYVESVDGKLKNSIDTSYIAWCKNVGYEVWPTIKNDLLGIDKTSELLNDMVYRQNFIDNIVTIVKKYNFKGINLDFEHIYKNDRGVYAELVRELSATLRRNGIVSTVDVNVPDGSDNWSLCYDTKAISDAADYTILMAYDQYGASSKKAGPVASLEWVETNLKKLIERDSVESSRLVLGIPFYSRFWRIKNESVISTSTMSMKTATEYMEKYKNYVKWNEEAGQYVIEYSDKGDNIEIWVENEKSVEEKLKLIGKYELAGFAAWRWGFENYETWELIGRK